MPLRPMGREQMWMLPPTLDELLPLDHPARFVAEFVDALDREDWGELGVKIDGEVLGAPAYHPRALLSVWLYGFMTGVRSCRKLEAACRDQIPYLWLTGWQHPDHNTLWRFYKGHRQACPAAALAHVVLDYRVLATEPVLRSQTVIEALRRVPLLPRKTPVLFQYPVDHPVVRVQLRATRR